MAEPRRRVPRGVVQRFQRPPLLGAGAAALLFSRFSGEWEVLEDEYNRAALGFWRRVIGQQTQGRYTESRIAGEVCHRFRTDPRAASSTPRD